MKLSKILLGLVLCALSVWSAWGISLSDHNVKNTIKEEDRRAADLPEGELERANRGGYSSAASQKQQQYYFPSASGISSLGGYSGGYSGHGSSGYGQSGYGGHSGYGSGYGSQGGYGGGYGGQHHAIVTGHGGGHSVGHGVHGEQEEHGGLHKVLALKGLLIPLAGIALLGAAAAFSTNPVLLQLGVLNGKRKKRSVQQMQNYEHAYPANPFLQSNEH